MNEWNLFTAKLILHGPFTRVKSAGNTNHWFPAEECEFDINYGHALMF